MRLAGLTLIVPFSLAVSCATVPDDAPQAFHEAEKALEKADDKDVDDHFPESLDLAEEEFDQALDNYDNEKEDPGAAADSTEKAQSVADLSNELIAMTDRINRWDSQAKNLGDAGLAANEFTAAGERLDSENFNVAIVDVEKPQLDMSMPVAYFETSKAELDDNAKERLEKLAENIKKNHMSIKISGFADPRGDESYNIDLSRQRAMAVKDQLVAAGVDESRISTNAEGEISVNNQRSQSALQQARKAEITVSTMAE